MSIQKITLPDLGVESAEVVEIMFAVGDTITADDNIALLESDKASTEVPAGVAGVITEIHLAVGDNVGQGADFVSVDASAGDSSVESSSIDSDSSSDNPSKENDAQEVKKETTKEAVTATEQTAEKGTKAEPEQTRPQQAISDQSVSVQASASNTSSSQEDTESLGDATNVYAGPAVRKLCRELGVNISQVTGTAIHGRIVKDDVHAFVKERLNAKPTAIAAAVAQEASHLPPLPDMTGELWGPTHTQELTKLQKVSIPQLCYNNHLPQVTQFDLADITDTENYRKSIKDKLRKDGTSLTMVAFVMKAVAFALRKYPIFNSHLSDDNTHLIMRDEVHIGMAVATDAGLIVPVVRNPDQKGLVQIANEIKDVAIKARDKKLGMPALTGAGFTISSQGNMGGTYFTPLVNFPQVAILGVSEATIQPRWNETTQTFEPRLMLPLSLSYDHRVINGADAAIFTRYVTKLLADTRMLLL